MINMDWYRIFLYTARNGNLTKAAQELYITQPSVSYAIKQMEEALGLKLFNRLSKGVELTPEGRALLNYVEQSFSLLDAGEKKMHALKHLAGGELRIGASDSLFKHVLLPELNRFRTEYPQVRIRLSHGKTTDIVQRLEDGQIDCGIVHFPIASPQLDITPLAAIQDCFVAGSSYRELSGRSLSAGEMADLPLLLLSQGSSTRRFVEQWFHSQGFAVEPDIELGSIDLLIEFAGLGFGVAFVTRSFVEKQLRSRKLFELQPAEPIPARTIGVAVRRDLSLSLPAERFVRALIDAFR
ncbi:LysR family transcriptional regulator [Paenibacillus contaminans]|uniref:LysR family transcriptional regulator n=1 Tax=Paenibacillus contaminans TaxID=450362 RepID=A0A329ML25_9BACL|nr:LysR family transcriptional regulator [Paenibacillus contaminans]RAV20505.1 LysR family transcriptional regulator [Paenibacillus contaminans]